MTPIRRGRTTVTAAIYIRLSVDRGGARATAAEQETACRTIADSHGWTVGPVYADNDLILGNRRRDAFETMVAEIRAGTIGAVVTYHLERLVRASPELEPFIAVCDEQKVELATAIGEIDLATKEGREFARQMGAFARYERDRSAAESTARHTDDAESGKPWVSGSRCYGYTTDGLSIVEDEAAVIRDVAKRIVADESLRTIVNGLNEQQKLTARGNEWHPTALRRLIINPRITGKRVYRGKATNGDWPAILTASEQRTVLAALKKRTRAHSKDSRNAVAPRRYLLTGGLLICGLCGSPLASQPSAGSKRGYVCRKGAGAYGCGRIRIAADRLENEVAARVLARVSSDWKRISAFLTAVDRNGNDILSQIAVLEGELTVLGRDYADEKIGRTEFHAARNRMSERIEDLRSTEARANRLIDLPGHEPEQLQIWWNDASLQQRRDLVSVVLDHIVVGPATKSGPIGLDYDRLQWVWRVP